MAYGIFATSPLHNIDKSSSQPSVHESRINSKPPRVFGVFFRRSLYVALRRPETNEKKIVPGYASIPACSRREAYWSDQCVFRRDCTLEAMRTQGFPLEHTHAKKNSLDSFTGCSGTGRRHSNRVHSNRVWAEAWRRGPGTDRPAASDRE